jgi:hypothetical protein|nr:MAG TPA: hypothetical protein [Crassvirales sp.]
MSGCSSGQAGSQFCDSCSDYSCSSNPHYISPYPDAEYDIYEGVEHLKGVKAPNIPIVDIKEETQNQIRKLWDNFDNL